MTPPPRETWVEGATGSLFDVDNLPYGVFTRAGETVLFTIGPFDATVEGVDFAGQTLVRLFAISMAIGLFGLIILGLLHLVTGSGAIGALAISGGGYWLYRLGRTPWHGEE